MKTVIACLVLLLGSAMLPAAPAAPAPMQSRIDSRRPLEPEGQITTEVQDPRHPNEPWTIITFRLPDESAEAHVKRHLASVEAVRSALR